MILTINILLSSVGIIIEKEDINMPTHYKVFKNEAITKGMCVQTQYNVKMGGLSEKYSTLFKVPGNKFYKYFKTHILKKELDKRDLLFISDGDLCSWSVEDDSVAARVTPDGELSIEEVKMEYPYFLNLLKNELKGLNESQIRKIVNVTLSLCSTCHDSDRSCQCWNDE